MILVTGATGLLGSHLTAALVMQNKKVRALYRHKDKIENTKKILAYYTTEVEKYFSLIEWHQADVTNYFSLQEPLTNVSEVYHCAGLVSFDEADSKQLYAINAEGTAHVINTCLDKGVQKFCHVSSVATLQIEANKKYIDEFSVWKTAAGNSSYAITKYRGEFEAWRGAAEGLQVLVVNPSVILGAGCWGQSSTQLITRCHKGLPIYTEGITGYVDVRDVANCMIRLTNENKFGHRYILNADNCSFKQITHQLQQNFNKPTSKIKAGSFLLNLALFGDAFLSTITGKKRSFTKSMLQSAQNKHYYNNTKVCKELNYQFIPVANSLAYVANLYSNDNK
ncbi:MAG TPA: NAD-dependent epimerase/dehydratase family protein [Bacteroidia bacterium]|nr:NAD-dependent epimerase/dehydratase family protein [Bacteroidia bacterium]